MKHLLLIFLLWGMALSCSVSPQPINYQTDQCHSCKMIISDPRFGAELVTLKGKIYKYDAIECMVTDVLKNGEDHYAYILVTDFATPGTLVDAREMQYLISEKLPSPMGGNLSAHRSITGELSDASVQWHTWEELLMHRQ
jgi:copper chaperone NosL